MSQFVDCDRPSEAQQHYDDGEYDFLKHSRPLTRDDGENVERLQPRSIVFATGTDRALAFESVDDDIQLHNTPDAQTVPGAGELSLGDVVGRGFSAAMEEFTHVGWTDALLVDSDGEEEDSADDVVVKREV